MNMKWLNLLALSSIAVAILTSASPAAAGNGQSADEQAALKVEIASKVAQWTGLVDPSGKAEAVRAISEIAEAIQQPVQEKVDSPEIEVRKRVGQLTDGLLEAARLRKALSILQPSKRKSLIDYFNSDRTRFNGIFEPLVPTYIYNPLSIGLLIPSDDLRSDYDPVMQVCIRFGNESIARAAVDLVHGSDIHSKEMIESLMHSVVDPISHGINPELTSARMMYFGMQPGDPWLQCLSALKTMGGAEQAKLLLAAMLKKKELSVESYMVDLALCRAIASMGNIALLPPLMDRLEKLLAGGQGQSIAVEGFDGGVQPCDALIDCANRLAGLGEVLVPNVEHTVEAFKSEQDRANAISALLAWWKKNKAAVVAQYPASLPDLDAWASQSRSIPTTASASNGNAKRFDPAEAKALSDKVRLACQAAVKDLGNDRVARREEADRFIREAYQTYLDALVEGSDHWNSAGLANELLDKAVMESQVRFVSISMSPASRQKLQACRRELPEVFENVFSINRSMVLNGVRSLSKLGDKTASGEPLLAYCLEHASVEVVKAALDVAAEGKYKSDEIVAALSGIFNNPHFNWYQYYYTVNVKWMPMKAMEALGAIGTPMAISTLVSSGNLAVYNQYRAMAIFEVVGNCKDKNVVPALVAALDTKSGVMGLGVNAQQLSMASTDSVLLALTKITGQKPSDYGISYIEVPVRNSQTRFYGFHNETERAAGIAKFKLWWQENKNKPPYNNLTPLPPVKIAPDNMMLYGAYVFSIHKRP